MTEELITDLALDPVAQGDLAHLHHAIQELEGDSARDRDDRWVWTRSSRARCSAPATACASPRSSSKRRATGTCGRRASSGTSATSSRSRARSPGTSRRRSSCRSPRSASARLASQQADQSRGLRALSQGRFEWNKLTDERHAQGDRVLRAGARARSRRSRATAAGWPTPTSSWCRSSGSVPPQEGMAKVKEYAQPGARGRRELGRGPHLDGRRRCSSATGTAIGGGASSQRAIELNPELLDGPPRLLGRCWRAVGPLRRGDRAGSPVRSSWIPSRLIINWNASGTLFLAAATTRRWRQAKPQR